jgi:hypothetical protein
MVTAATSHPCTEIGHIVAMAKVAPTQYCHDRRATGLITSPSKRSDRGDFYSPFGTTCIWYDPIVSIKDDVDGNPSFSVG